MELAADESVESDDPSRLAVESAVDESVESDDPSRLAVESAADEMAGLDDPNHQESAEMAAERGMGDRNHRGPGLDGSGTVRDGQILQGQEKAGPSRQEKGEKGGLHAGR